MRPKLYFINRFFYPDQSATAQILTDLAVHLAEKGWDLHVITSRGSITDQSVWLDKTATWQSIKITRVSTTRFGRKTVLGRLIDYLSFYLATFFAAIRLLKRDDYVVAKTDPPMLSVPIGIASRIKGFTYINWLQDLFPEVAQRDGIGFVQGPVGSILLWLRNRSLRRAKMNVAIGDLMRDKIVADGVAPDATCVIPNFIDDRALVPDALAAKRMRADWGFSESDFIVEYSGNLGRAHDIETVLRAAQILAPYPEIKFLFVGGGHQRATLSTRAEQLGISSFRFQPYQDRSLLAASLGVGDIHWMSLKPEMEALIVPSKFYGIAAAGKPVLMIGDPQGEISKIVKAHQCGLVHAPGEGEGVADTLLKLSKDGERRDKMGLAARAYIEAYGARGHAMQLWDELFETLWAQDSQLEG